jgi:hypothetical protein
MYVNLQGKSTVISWVSEGQKIVIVHLIRTWSIFSFYSIFFIYHFTKWINPGVLKWIGVAVSEFRRFCNNPSKLPYTHFVPKLKFNLDP